MSLPPVSPAFTAAQWAAVLRQADDLAQIRAGFQAIPFSSHQLAALFLHGEPFGFDQSDVVDETEVADYCDAMARRHTEAGDAATAASFSGLGERHRLRAAKIAALLPPPEVIAAESGGDS
jgi:hypothetical protein